MVWRGEHLLMGERINSHGTRTWQFPGGHLEFGETVTGCAIREVREETGVSICNIVHSGYTNDVFIDADKHYVTLYVSADYDSGEPRVMEPDKCAAWGWYRWNDLPQPLFLPVKNYLKLYPDLYAMRYGAESQAALRR